jgi:hypothetical protein
MPGGRLDLNPQLECSYYMVKRAQNSPRLCLMYGILNIDRTYNKQAPKILPVSHGGRGERPAVFTLSAVSDCPMKADFPD